MHIGGWFSFLEGYDKIGQKRNVGAVG